MMIYCMSISAKATAATAPLSPGNIPKMGGAHCECDTLLGVENLDECWDLRSIYYFNLHDSVSRHKCSGANDENLY